MSDADAKIDAAVMPFACRNLFLRDAAAVTESPLAWGGVISKVT